MASGGSRKGAGVANARRAASPLHSIPPFPRLPRRSRYPLPPPPMRLEGSLASVSVAPGAHCQTLSQSFPSATQSRQASDPVTAPHSVLLASTPARRRYRALRITTKNTSKRNKITAEYSEFH
ncbi:hypothetical protein SKAU_G00298060 [Synaphobranchus kaupii]|uniref:Uncharacterized protein n=1 Tax=Synaphobranchus kaupii TaxID=118154 RepID=A0A9Q1IN00_SYNKA|nr:hypothetical protein SKAU_G00298060 [Synaphobranchus kaupii]